MAVCSILYQLAIRPEQQKKMYDELKRLIPDPNAPLTSKVLDEMVFVKAFVKEVFRYSNKYKYFGLLLIIIVF